tara:strand:- start:860 stop:1564 length:705 start_codon:yes stop_codon:yes gene_type:complete
MGNTADLVSIKMVADRLMQNPLLKDLNYEFIVDHAMQVLRIIEAPSLYVTRRERINIENYRGLKPIDMMTVEAISKVEGQTQISLVASEDIQQEFYGQGIKPSRRDLTYSLNSKYVSVNFEKGDVDIIYKAIATDEDCYPMVLNNETLLRCVQSYIKYSWFQILYDMDMISERKKNSAEIDYSFNVAQAEINLKMPSIDEMEALVNVVTQFLPSSTEHSRRFEFLGAQEKLRIH